SELLVHAIGQYPEGNIIVYAPTIQRVGATVALLENHGIRAIGYHGQMDSAARRQNQEVWMSDEVRVLVGTLAFGLGINKATVRAVIHLALPKSLEQYYQEAGRAGRDGEPADCVLLWQKRDAGLLAHFIEQVNDPEERQRAWQRYHQVRQFVEAPVCRHRQICLHFGETPVWTECGACDVCGYEPAWLAAPAPEQARRARPARERAVPAAAAGAEGDGLREKLREWRRQTAAENRTPAYVVMHDKSLDELVRLRPRTLDELLEVSGCGERKTALLGEAILRVIAEATGR